MGEEGEREGEIQQTFISTFLLYFLKVILFGLQVHRSSFLIALLKTVNFFHGPADKSSQYVGFCKVLNG